MPRRPEDLTPELVESARRGVNTFLAGPTGSFRGDLNCSHAELRRSAWSGVSTLRELSVVAFGQFPADAGAQPRPLQPWCRVLLRKVPELSAAAAENLLVGCSAQAAGVDVVTKELCIDTAVPA